MGKDEYEFGVDEEDYQYTGDHYANASDSASNSRIEQFKKPLIFLGVLVVAGIGGVYVKNWVAKRNQLQALPVAVQQTQKAETPVAKPEVNAAAKRQDELAAEALSKLDATHQLLAADSQQESALINEIKALTETNRQITRSLTQLSANLNNMQRYLDQVSGHLNQLTTGMNELVDGKRANDKARKAEHHAQQRAKVEAMLKTRKSYHVVSVIPGRAWLKDNNGHVFTVSVGKSLAGYGKIAVISVDEGTVKTSTGDILRFGIDAG